MAIQKTVKEINNSTPCKKQHLKISFRNLAHVITSGTWTPHANFGADWFSGGFPQIRDFLYCPYFLSILSTGQTVAPVHSLNGSNDVFLRKEVSFGVRMTADAIWGKYAPYWGPSQKIR